MYLYKDFFQRPHKEVNKTKIKEFVIYVFDSKVVDDSKKLSSQMICSNVNTFFAYGRHLM